MHPLVSELNTRIQNLANAGVTGGGILRECAQELEILERQRDRWQTECAKMHHFFATRCRICYWPPDGREPIVHNPFVSYDGNKMAALLTEMHSLSL
jgi:hypothetical protein